MAALSSYLENELLEHSLGKSTFTMPAASYLGLYSDVPTPSGGTELSVSGYIRIAVTWNAAANGVITNAAQVTFPTATSNWPTIYGAGIFDALTVGTGHMLYWIQLTNPRVVSSGQAFIVSAGTLSVSLN